MIHRRHLVAAFALAAITHAGSAQTWPTKTIRLVVPFRPGGGTDFIARVES